MKGNVMEKFNMNLSKEDVIAHKQWLELAFSTTDDNGEVVVIDAANVFKCLKQYCHSFGDTELGVCPVCGYDDTKIRQLNYYRRRLLVCNVCQTVISSKKFDPSKEPTD